MGKYKRVILTALFLTLISACREEISDVDTIAHRQPGVYYGSGTNSIEKLSQNAVLLRVNGRSFTRRDFDIDQSVYGMLMSFIRTGKISDSDKDIEKLKAIRAPKVLNTILRRELLNQEARKRRIKASKAAIKECRSSLEKILFKKNSMTIEKLAEQMGDACGGYMQERICKDAENLELTWKMGGKALVVTEEDVTVASNRVASINAMTDATNSVLMARLKIALDRVRKGEDFAKVGAELSMIEPSEAQNWGTFSLEDFESEDYPDMAAFLKKKPTEGTIAGPFQCEDGVSIVKVMKVFQDEDAVQTEDDESSDATRYILSRITVETFERRNPISRESIREIIVNYKKKNFEKELGERLFAEAVIEFPSGTNLFTKAEVNEQPMLDSVKHSKSKNKKQTYRGKGGENVK